MRILRSDGERALSAHLFGHRHKMELLSAFAEAPDGRINLSQVAEDRGVKASVYYPPVKDLIAARLVVRVEPVPKERRRWYERTGDDQVWLALGATLRALRDLSSAAGVDR